MGIFCRKIVQQSKNESSEGPTSKRFFIYKCKNEWNNFISYCCKMLRLKMNGILRNALIIIWYALIILSWLSSSQIKSRTKYNVWFSLECPISEMHMDLPIELIQGIMNNFVFWNISKFDDWFPYRQNFNHCFLMQNISIVNC